MPEAIRVGIPPDGLSGRLVGRRAIVTGGSRGIGAACARRLVAEGAQVAILDLPETGPSGMSLSYETGYGVTFVGCDVRRAGDCADAVARAAQALGGVDVLVNNAGVAPASWLADLSEEDWERTFDVNVRSIHLITRHVLPLMRAAGGGVIINMACESTTVDFPMHPAHCAAKTAVVQLTRSLAIRHAPDGIRVNAVCPGTIDTELYRGFLASVPDPAGVEAAVLARHPLGLGRPEDVAAVVAFLASDDARYMTGAAMAVDGGSTAQ